MDWARTRVCPEPQSYCRGSRLILYLKRDDVTGHANIIPQLVASRTRSSAENRLHSHIMMVHEASR